MSEGLTNIATVAGASPRVAVELARELDDLENSQGHDIEAILATATRIERDAGELCENVLALRARLIQADMARRRGDVAGAAKTFADVHRWAELNQSQPLLARSHFHLALTYHYLGDNAASLEHSISAVELMDQSTSPGLQVIHLIRLANSLAVSGAVDAARDRYLQAEQIAITIEDLTRQMLVLNNLAYTEYEIGALDQASAVVIRMHAVAAALGRDFLITERDTIANIQIGLGQYAAAEKTVQAVVNAPQWFEMHDLADAALTLAEAQRRLGAVDRAQASLDRCQQLCADRELFGVQVRAYAEQAELYALTGNYQDAFAEYKRFHAAAEELRSSQQGARALARQAMFENAEARRDAERYREQARRDPLTSLYNRRHVDEQLPQAITRANGSSNPLTVALVDLDYFKRINDLLSHNVGDKVLVAIAGLLNSIVADAGFVARMGGEEFLIVLPDMAAEDAHRRLESVHHSVQSYPWQPITGDLPVTVSIGVSSTGTVSGDPLEGLLADADRKLYAAKHAGRNRMVTR